MTKGEVWAASLAPIGITIPRLSLWHLLTAISAHAAQCPTFAALLDASLTEDAALADVAERALAIYGTKPGGGRGGRGRKDNGNMTDGKIGGGVRS